MRLGYAFALVRFQKPLKLQASRAFADLPVATMYIGSPFSLPKNDPQSIRMNVRHLHRYFCTDATRFTTLRNETPDVMPLTISALS
jgi:hypothetical protein